MNRIVSFRIIRYNLLKFIKGCCINKSELFYVFIPLRYIYDLCYFPLCHLKCLLTSIASLGACCCIHIVVNVVLDTFFSFYLHPYLFLKRILTVCYPESIVVEFLLCGEGLRSSFMVESTQDIKIWSIGHASLAFV